MHLLTRSVGGRGFVVGGTVALLVAAGTAMSVSGATLTAVAMTGVTSGPLSPQLPAGPSSFTYFPGAVLDDHGHVAFLGTVGGASGVWSTLSGPLAVVSASGLPLPGTLGAIEGETLRMAFAGNGRIALDQVFSQGTTVGYSIWASGADGTGPISMIASQGNQAAGFAAGVTYSSNLPTSVYNEGLSGRGLLLSRDGSLLWEGTTTGMASPSSAVWRNDAGGTTLRVTNTQTTPSAGLPWQSFLGNGLLRADDGGHLVVAASTSVVNGGTTYAFITDRTGALTQSYPSLAGVAGSSYSVLGSAGNGDLALGGYITPTGQSQRFSLIRQDGLSGWRRVMDNGAPAPSPQAGASAQLIAPVGTTVSINGLAAPSSSGLTAFNVTFNTVAPGWVGSTGLVVADASNNLTLLARTGMTVPGQAANILIDGISDPAMNNLGWVAFTGTMTASPANLNGRGLFMAQGADGVLRVIVEAGDAIDIPGLGTRHVSGLRASTAGNVGGQTWWTDDGRYALIATLAEDPSRSVVITGIVPAPGAAALLGLGGVMLVRRRRRR